MIGWGDGWVNWRAEGEDGGRVNELKG